MASNSAAQHFDFIKGLIARPKNVAAITPSSPALARAIAEQVDPAMDGNILELGPGTGVVTEALVEHGIAPQRIVAIEYDPDFAEMVAGRCPGTRVLRGDAFNFPKLTGNIQFAAIVSGLPLLTHPMEERLALLETALRHLKPGAPFVQLSYGTNPPVPAPESISLRRAALVLMNLPPARVWTYRQV
ncbi:MAG TPA: methyltransferase domain-containing protein [Rhizomicrobium sp.]|nr:methyltransferase domain-containing protein [Rhizomicrobium sp.]